MTFANSPRTPTIGQSRSARRASLITVHQSPFTFLQTSTDILTRVRRVELRTSKLANDLMVGAYNSQFKGRGMNFEELREYVPGDDVRTIDWNVTARMRRPFVKRSEEHTSELQSR